jgi:hypothetical protein
MPMLVWLEAYVGNLHYRSARRRTLDDALPFGERRLRFAALLHSVRTRTRSARNPDRRR